MTATENIDIVRVAWENETYQLEGINPKSFEGEPSNGYDLRQGIDRDQAVDDEGHAIYEEYVLSRTNERGEEEAYEFDAQTMEEFAAEW